MMKKYLFSLGFLCSSLSSYAEECPSVDSIIYRQDFNTAEFSAPEGYTLQDRFISGTVASIKPDFVLFNAKVPNIDDLQNSFTNIHTTSRIYCNYIVSTVINGELIDADLTLSLNGSLNVVYDLGKDWRLYVRGLGDSEYYCQNSLKRKRDCSFAISL